MRHRLSGRQLGRKSSHRHAMFNNMVIGTAEEFAIAGGSTDIIAALAAVRNVTPATLVVKQTSPEEANDIKDWLVKQQSGVMQGLFSHMVGELMLNQTVVVAVEIAPKPSELGASVPTPRKAAGKPKAASKE